MTRGELFHLIGIGKEHKGFFMPDGFQKVGHCTDQYAQYTVYQNGKGEVVYTRYADMD